MVKFGIFFILVTHNKFSNKSAKFREEKTYAEILREKNEILGKEKPRKINP